MPVRGKRYQEAEKKVGKLTELEINYYGTVDALVKIAFKDGEGNSTYVGGIACTVGTSHYYPDQFPVNLPMMLRAGADDWTTMITLVNAGYAAGDDMTITLRGEIYQ